MRSTTSTRRLPLHFDQGLGVGDDWDGFQRGCYKAKKPDAVQYCLAGVDTIGFDQHFVDHIIPDIHDGHNV
jgi:hypothetical protein